MNTVRCDGSVSWFQPGRDMAMTWRLFCANSHNFLVVENGLPSMLG